MKSPAILPQSIYRNSHMMNYSIK